MYASPKTSGQSEAAARPSPALLTGSQKDEQPKSNVTSSPNPKKSLESIDRTHVPGVPSAGSAFVSHITLYFTSTPHADFRCHLAICQW